ncbi:MAG: hypothetical protein Q4B52_01860 [Tissierellia bacterium]|nr:hypothetical protein [Tissierellia bacterium]
MKRLNIMILMIYIAIVSAFVLAIDKNHFFVNSFTIYVSIIALIFVFLKLLKEIDIQKKNSNLKNRLFINILVLMTLVFFVIRYLIHGLSQMELTILAIISLVIIIFSITRFRKY